MVDQLLLENVSEALIHKARQIKFLFSDCDGVLTDGGVYYSEDGEYCKRFSIRDGMGVERLRSLVSIDVGIISGEVSPSLKKRAEKLAIHELHLGIKDKPKLLILLSHKLNLSLNQMAFIGDDINDLEAIKQVGISACPADSFYLVKEKVDYICHQKGGHGAFREFCELLISLKQQTN